MLIQTDRLKDKRHTCKQTNTQTAIQPRSEAYIEIQLEEFPSAVFVEFRGQRTVSNQIERLFRVERYPVFTIDWFVKRLCIGQRISLNFAKTMSTHNATITDKDIKKDTSEQDR